MPRFPPQGTFLPPDLRTYFSQKVGGLDSSAYDCLCAKPLIDNGYMTLDDLANYIQNEGVASGWGFIEAWYYLYGADWVAQLLSSSKLSASRIADIINNAVSVRTVKAIFQSSYISADRVQAILYAMVDTGYYDKLLNLMTFDAPDATIFANTTWSSGVNRYRVVSVASNCTLTLNTLPNVIIADSIYNSGIIASATQGGGAGAGGGGAGGGGAQGLIILARSISVGTINANGDNGVSVSAAPTGTASGNAGAAGNLWIISSYNAGNGGAGGGYGSTAAAGGGGGGGRTGGAGGTSTTAPGGTGGSATVTTFSSASSLLSELVKAVVDWYIKNVLGKTPTTTKSIPNLVGSGGGGGAGNTSGSAAAAGGGGNGGEVIVFGITVNAGTINAKGGNGGNTGQPNSGGGGGGGGGVIYVLYKTLNGTFTFSVAAGTGGSAYSGTVNSNYNGSAGTNGSAATFAV